MIIMRITITLFLYWLPIFAHRLHIHLVSKPVNYHYVPPNLCNTFSTRCIILFITVSYRKRRRNGWDKWGSFTHSVYPNHHSWPWRRFIKTSSINWFFFLILNFLPLQNLMKVHGTINHAVMQFFLKIMKLPKNLKWWVWIRTNELTVACCN